MSSIQNAPPSKRLKLESSPSPSTFEPNRDDSENKTVESVDQDHCSICLQSLADRTVIPTCAHEFCFECITIWSEQSRKCPLCSQAIGEYLIHHIRSTHDYQKYYLPPLRSSPTPRTTIVNRLRTFRGSRRERRWGRQERQDQEQADRLDRAIARRRWIYQHDLYAKHVASNAYTRYRPYPTPAQFSASPDLTSRMTTFLRRELRVWANLDVEFLTTFTISLMKSIDIRSESAVKLLAEFLDMDAPYLEGGRHVNAEHFAHEIYSYLRSPYRDLNVYDSEVQYDIPADVPPPQQPQRVRRWREASSQSSPEPPTSSRHISRSRTPVPQELENRRASPGDEVSGHAHNRSAERRCDLGRRSRSRTGSPDREGHSSNSRHGHSKRPRDGQEPNQDAQQKYKGKGKVESRHSSSLPHHSALPRNFLVGSSTNGRASHSGDCNADHLVPDSKPTGTARFDVDKGSSADSSNVVFQPEAPAAIDGGNSTLIAPDTRSSANAQSANAFRFGGNARAPRNRTIAQSVQAHLSPHNATRLPSGASNSVRNALGQEPSPHCATSEVSQKPSLLERLSHYRQVFRPNPYSYSYESHDRTAATMGVPFAETAFPSDASDDALRKGRLPIPDITTRVHRSLTKLKDERSTSPSPSTTADRNKSSEKIFDAQERSAATSVHEGNGCHSSVLQDHENRAKTSPSTPTTARPKTSLNGLMEKKTLAQIHVGSSTSASPRGFLNNDHEIGNSSGRDAGEIAELEARLRTRAQLRVRLAAASADAHTRKNRSDGSIGSNGGTISGSREEALRLKLHERREC